jgi:signal peptide peptidase SppA
MSHIRFLHIRELLAQPWLITPDAYHAVATLVDRHMDAAAGFKLDDIFGEQPQMTIDRATGIAEIPVQGVIGKGLSKIEKSCGAVGTEDIAANLSAALSDPAVKGILLNIASPGGTVNGTPEVASLVRSAAERKPVLAFTDSLMASAAYWIGSQADMVIASQSSSVGSIGVYIPVTDMSRRAEMLGVKVELVKNKEGTFKGAGYPGTSLTDAQRENLQGHADEIFGMFSAAVQGKRNVPKGAMRGQVFLGGEARNQGLVDDVGGLDLARRSLSGLIAMRK